MQTQGLTVVTEPASEPISLAEAKLFLRVDHSDEDDLISALVTASRQILEQETRRCFLATSLRATYPVWEERMYLPRSPLSSVTAVKYYDDANELQTLSSDYYLVEDEEIQPSISLRYGYSWPTTYSRPLPIHVEFDAGYETVPGPIVQAMYLLIGDMYEHREAQSELKLSDNKVLDRLIWPYRVLDFS